MIKAEETLKDTTIELRNLRKNHNNILRQRNYYKFKKGNSFYVWYDPDSSVEKYKVGFTSNINVRLKSERTSVPNLKLSYLVYLEQAKFIEDCILQKFRKYRVPLNHELVKLKDEVIINTAREQLNFYEFDYIEEEELIKYNEEEESDIIFEFIEDEEPIKKCSTCKEEKIYEMFAKNSTRGDGLNNSCKECYKILYRRRRDAVKNEVEMKRCTKCSVVKQISDFYNRVGSSDGKTSECKDCTINMYEARTIEREHIEVQVKVCIDCKTEKDRNDFGKKRDSPDGLMPKCRKCCAKYAKKISSTVEPGEFKLCNLCNIRKEIHHFWNHKQRKDGINKRCISCCKNEKK